MKGVATDGFPSEVPRSGGNFWCSSDSLNNKIGYLA